MALPHMAILKEKLGTGTGVDTSVDAARKECVRHKELARVV
jgi:hypothetical protein